MAAPAEEQQENNDGSTFDRLTGTQKSAILMMLIGEDEASEILRNLSPREVQHLGTAMYSVQGLDRKQLILFLMSSWQLLRRKLALEWAQETIFGMS